MTASTKPVMGKANHGCGRAVTTRRAGSVLHCFSAALLLIFAASHFLFLTVPDSSHGLVNTVFPFFANRTLYLLAGSVELTAGLLCLKFHGGELANVVILTFVAIILWYRWAFHFTGGAQCGCLGILGRLLHLNQSLEESLPVFALILLTLTTAPSLWRRLKRLDRGNVLGLVLLAALFSHRPVMAQETLNVQGHYSLLSYNPETKRAYRDSELNAAFGCVVSANTWRIAVTNLVDQASWELLIYDGTNSYMLAPWDGHFARPAPQTNMLVAGVTPSPLLNPPFADFVALYVPWLTYGLSPGKLSLGPRGVEIPLPWRNPRANFQAYGYRWLIESSADGRFIQDCQVVRDRALDLGLKEEFFRPEYDYPESVPDANRQRRFLDYRHVVTNGFVEARYATTEWCFTNQLSLPMASELRLYSFNYPSFPYLRAKLRADLITLSSQPEGLRLTGPGAPALVTDYRYRRHNRSRIFRYAEYTLGPEDAWKADSDPALLASAKRHLEHGPRYDNWGPTRRNVVAWLLLGAVLLPLAIVLLGKLHRRNKSTRESL